MADVAYLQLADQLERSLLRARPGERLPSENELAEVHGVSRITTRSALQELERRHLVTRRRGAGTFVAMRVEYPISSNIPPSFTETIRRAGHEPGSRVLSVRHVVPPARIRDGLELARRDRALRIERITTVDGIATSLGTSWIARVDPAQIRANTTDDVSLFAVLADAGCDLHREWYTAELETIPAEAATALGLEGRPQAWHTISANRCHATDEMVELSESWVRADVIRVRFELGPNRPVPTTETA